VIVVIASMIVPAHAELKIRVVPSNDTARLDAPVRGTMQVMATETGEHVAALHDRRARGEVVFDTGDANA
jgi:hypothetical protein